MKAPKFMGGFWGKKRAVTLGYGGKEATVTFDEAYFAESIRQPMDKVAKEAAAPMPPPPAVNDAEMRALIAYVRSLSEGDSAEDPSGLIAKGKINNFSFAAYKGNWDRLPDFSQLKPFKTGTAKTGTADPGLPVWAKTSVWYSKATSKLPERATTHSTLAPMMAPAFTSTESWL